MMSANGKLFAKVKENGARLKIVQRDQLSADQLGMIKEIINNEM